MSTHDNVKTIAMGLIENEKERAGGQLTLEIIKDSVDKAMNVIGASFDDLDVQKLVSQFERDYQTFVGAALTLQSDEDCWEPWLAKKKAEIEWGFWERYRAYLLQRLGMPKPVVDSVDDVTDEVLGNLVNPKHKSLWDRRGMVVGHVQAGKTTNYAGLICKAADAGYKVIIVLTGFHSNLRTQTQIRLEEAFVGYDRAALQERGGGMVPVGAGLVSSNPSLKVNTITDRTEDGDFGKKVAKQYGTNPSDIPQIFVIKKNASVLKNLVKYLESVHTDRDKEGNHHISGFPLLLIDDEADQGSVDTKKLDFGLDGDPDPDHDPTKLNGLIRNILHIFTQSAYVGYTATPFANIFIHNEADSAKYGEDLFPRSFITTMPTPSNYIGPEDVFGLTDDESGSRSNALPIIRYIDDYAASEEVKERNGWMPPKHDKNHVPSIGGKQVVPPSLKEAIYAFITGCAVRMARGQGTKHNSMLIHVTRFTDVQERVFQQVSDLMRDVQQALLYGEEGSRDLALNEIRKVWDEDFAKTNLEINDDQCPAHSWAEISERILSSAQSISVRRINGTAGDVLDYEQHKNTGLNVIAIGGDKLSRGLTLEGLTVSYFTRPSRMYDTLMQMGRWFGYRDGFLDVCRLYAPKVLVDWFEFITDASDQLRREFVLMGEMGETPATFGQRVRTHPVLMVTSQVKMRHTVELTCSYQGAISETIVFSRETNDVDDNYAACESLINIISSYSTERRCQIRLETDKVISGKYLWSGVRPDHVLEFLKAYSTPPHARRVNTGLLAQYIEKQLENGDLNNWSILLAGKEPNGSDGIEIAGYPTGLLIRADHPSIDTPPENEPSVYRIRRLVSPSDEAWDLSEDQYLNARNLTDVSRSTRPGGEEIRVSRNKSNALLIVYPLLSRKWTGPKTATDSCYMGFALSFPGNKSDVPIKYRVNQVYQGQMDD